MLNNEELKKIEDYIDESIKDISDKSNIKDKNDLESLVKTTINIMTPKSKMISTSIYDFLKKHTLTNDLYNNSSNKADFYRMNFSKQLEDKFTFEIPNDIDIKKYENYANAIIASGIIAGGIGAIPIRMYTKTLTIPIAIGAIIAFVVYKQLKKKQFSKLDEIKKEYLLNVKDAFMQWVKSVDEYYESIIKDFEKGLIKNG